MRNSLGKWGGKFSLHVSLKFLGTIGKLGGEELWILVELHKVLFSCTNKFFALNEVGQVWSCCAASTPFSVGRALRAANAPSPVPGRPHSQQVQANLSKKSSCTDLSLIPQPLWGLGDSRRQGCSSSKVSLPCLSMIYRRMNSSEVIKALIQCTHSSRQSSPLWPPRGYHSVLSPHLTRMSVPESLKQGVFGGAGLPAGHTALTPERQLRNAGIWDFSGETLLKDLWGVLY